MIMDINRAYEVNTSTGDKFNLAISEYTKGDTSSYLCYSEHNTTYTFICDNCINDNGNVSYVGILIDRYDNMYDALLKEIKSDRICINMQSDLCVLQDNGSYVLWDCIYDNDLRDLCNDSARPSNRFSKIRCKALNIKQNKLTGNYKVKANIKCNEHTRYFNLLMDESGKIIKHAEIFNVS